MKQLISLMLCAALLLIVFPVAGNAAEQETIYFDDGSYMTVEVIHGAARASGNVTGSKKYTYYDDNDASQWKAVLTGSFTYTGSSATCTSSSVDVTIYNSAWYTGYKTASKSGNKAKASVTMKLSNNDTTLSVPVNLTLTCDANGNLS